MTYCDTSPPAASTLSALVMFAHPSHRQLSSALPSSQHNGEVRSMSEAEVLNLLLRFKGLIGQVSVTGNVESTQCERP